MYCPRVDAGSASGFPVPTLPSWRARWSGGTLAGCRCDTVLCPDAGLAGILPKRNRPGDKHGSGTLHGDRSPRRHRSKMPSRPADKPTTSAPAKKLTTSRLARCGRHAECCVSSCAMSFLLPCCHFSSEAAMGCQEDDEPTHVGARCCCFDESSACWVSILLCPTLLPQALALYEHAYIYYKYGEIGVDNDEPSGYDKRLCTEWSCVLSDGGGNSDGFPVATTSKMNRT